MKGTERQIDKIALLYNKLNLTRQLPRRWRKSRKWIKFWMRPHGQLLQLFSLVRQLQWAKGNRANRKSIAHSDFIFIPVKRVIYIYTYYYKWYSSRRSDKKKSRSSKVFSFSFFLSFFCSPADGTHVHKCTFPVCGEMAELLRVSRTAAPRVYI